MKYIISVICIVLSLYANSKNTNQPNDTTCLTTKKQLKLGTSFLSTAYCDVHKVVLSDTTSQSVNKDAISFVLDIHLSIGSTRAANFWTFYDINDSDIFKIQLKNGGQITRKNLINGIMEKHHRVYASTDETLKSHSWITHSFTISLSYQEIEMIRNNQVKSMSLVIPAKRMKFRAKSTKIHRFFSDVLYDIKYNVKP